MVFRSYTQGESGECIRGSRKTALSCRISGHRREMLEKKRKQIVEMIAREAINPQMNALRYTCRRSSMLFWENLSKTWIG